MPEDGYPTDEELKQIDDWPETQGAGVKTAQEHWFDLFDFVKSLWHWDDWGWTELDGPPELLKEFSIGDKPKRWIAVSTGGWSGNEEIIGHMQRKFIFWGQTWVNHRVGGHFIFAIPKSDD